MEREVTEIYTEAAKALQDNSLEDILEFNDLTKEEVLVLLHEYYNIRFSRYV